VPGINDVDPVCVDEIPYTHIELQLEIVKDDPVTVNESSYTDTWVQLDD